MRHPPISAQITFLYTPNLAQTARFYEQTLGLPLKLDQGNCRIYEIGQHGYLGFCQRDPSPEQSSRQDASQVIVTLVTPDVYGWYEYLKERGVVFEQAPRSDDTYNIYHCFFRDPNGYLLEVQTFSHPF